MFQPRWAFQHSLILSRSRQGVYTPKIPPLPEPALGKMLITLNNSYFYLADFSMILSRSQDGVYTPKFVYSIHLPCHDHDRGANPQKSSITLTLPLGRCLQTSILTAFLWPIVIGSNSYWPIQLFDRSISYSINQPINQSINQSPIN